MKILTLLFLEKESLQMVLEEKQLLKAGDVTIARPNQSHGLRNEKDEPLVFLDIIAQNHALKAEK